MRLSLLICTLPLTGCLKAIYFTEAQTNNDLLKVDGMWIVKNDDAQSIRVELSKNSSEPVYIDWSSAKIKIDEDLPAGVNVLPNQAISMIRSSTAVFELEPLIEMSRDPSFLYPGEFIANPKSLKSGAKKVMIAVDVCTGPIEDGFRAIDCETGADGWKKAVIAGKLNFGSKSSAR